MKKAVIAAAALLLSGSALAQTTVSNPINATQQQQAVQNFAVLASAMQSDKVPDDVKAALMGCI